MKSYLEINLKVMLPYIAAIVIVFLFFVLGSGFVVDKISSSLARISGQKQEIVTLSEKISILEEGKNSFLEDSQSLIIALPQSNSSLFATAQLKSLASESTLTLENIKVGPEVKTEGNVSKADISFDMDGNVSSLLLFAQNIKTIAPLTRVQKFKISGGENSRANIYVSSYWSVLPTKIPNVADPIKTLSPEDESVLKQTAELRSSQSTILTPLEGEPSSDPFFGN